MSGPTASITYAWDGPLAAPAQGDVLYYDGTKWAKLPAGTSGQALVTGGAGANPSWGSAGVTDHGALTGLGDDDHAGYALLAGRVGGQTLTSPVSTSGSPFVLTINGGAHTTLAASAEAVDVNIALNRTVQWATGALTTQRAVVITPPTYAFVGASTITNAVTLDITGAPVAGTNATITNAVALRITNGTAGETALELKAHASQASEVNVAQFRNGAGTIISGVSGTGNLWSTNFYFTNPTSNVTRITLATNRIRFLNGGAEVFATNYAATGAAVVTPPVASYVGLAINLAAAQSANAINVTSSGGAAGDVFKVSAAGAVTIGGSGSGLTMGNGGFLSWVTSNGGNIKLVGGGTLTIFDGGSNILASFVHGAGGTLRNAGTTRFAWDATGIGFFAATPVAKATALTAADASALNTGDATSDTVIGNMRTRIAELETKLQAYGLLT